MLSTTCGDAVLSSAQVFRWHKVLKDGKEDVEGELPTECPSISRTEDNVALVKAVLKSDHRLNVRFITEEVGLPKTRYPSNNYQI